MSDLMATLRCLVVGVFFSVVDAGVEGFGLVRFDLRQEKGGRCYCSVPFWKGGTMRFELVCELLCLRLVRRKTRIELGEHCRVLL